MLEEGPVTDAFTWSVSTEVFPIFMLSVPAESSRIS